MRVSPPPTVAASRGTGRWRLQAVAWAFGFAAAFLLCYVVMVRTAAGQSADGRLFRLVFGSVPAGLPAELVTVFARAASVVVLAGAAAVLGVAAVGRRAWAGLAAALTTVGASVALGVHLRDDVLTRPRFTEEPFPLNGLPSTHATAAAALTVAVVLLWPRHRPWWLVNAAGVVLLVVAAGNIVSQAHRPSDVVASFLLVGAIACGSLALAGPPGPRH
jgi:membrane-associated phospholipid phosphatase